MSRIQTAGGVLERVSRTTIALMADCSKSASDWERGSTDWSPRLRCLTRSTRTDDDSCAVPKSCDSGTSDSFFEPAPCYAEINHWAAVPSTIGLLFAGLIVPHSSHIVSCTKNTSVRC